MQIFIRGLQYQNFAFDCNEDTKLKEVKIYISNKIGLPRTWQYFVSDCKSFHDENSTLKELGIEHEATLYLMLKWHGIGCNCIRCLKKGILLRNGKRLISSNSI